MLRVFIVTVVITTANTVIFIMFMYKMDLSASDRVIIRILVMSNNTAN